MNVTVLQYALESVRSIHMEKKAALKLTVFEENMVVYDCICAACCRIEYLDKWCRDLRILYLQSNLIAKIGNYCFTFLIDSLINYICI